MTARHATPYLSVELEVAGDTRSLTLLDRSGLVPEELIVETRPSATAPGATALHAEFWTGTELASGSVQLTPIQLRALAALCEAAASNAEAGGR